MKCFTVQPGLCLSVVGKGGAIHTSLALEIARGMYVKMLIQVMSEVDEE